MAPTIHPLKPVLTITLPLPSRSLSPNARTHFIKKCKAVKEARNVGRIVTLAALKGQPAPAIIGYSLHFYFPTAARRDDDNAAASFKSYRDGIADALRIDDHRLSMNSSPEMNVDKFNPRLEVKLYALNAELCQPCPPSTPPCQETADGQGLA